MFLRSFLRKILIHDCTIGKPKNVDYLEKESSQSEPEWNLRLGSNIRPYTFDHHGHVGALVMSFGKTIYKRAPRLQYCYNSF